MRMTAATYRRGMGSTLFRSFVFGLAANCLIWSFALTARSHTVSILPLGEYNLTPERAYVGYSGTCEMDPEVGQGVRVIKVIEGEVAHSAGLRVGDFIFKVNDEYIVFSDDLEMVFNMGKYRAGEPLKLDLKRGELRETVVFTPGRSSQESLDRLEEWIEIAKYRINHGLPLYCVDDPCEADISEGQRWGLFQRAIKGQEVVLKISRVAAGESGLELEMQPAIELSFGRLRPIDLNPQFGAIAQGLRQGDSFQLKVSCDTQGKLCEVRTMGPFPEYLREIVFRSQ